MQNYCGFTAHNSSQLLCYTMRTQKVLLTFAGSLCVLLSKTLGFLENRQKKCFISFTTLLFTTLAMLYLLS